MTKLQNKVVVGTESALKLRAVKAAFEGLNYLAEIIPYKADSGVSIQPIGTEEMEKGAFNRARSASMVNHMGAVFWIGIENGLVRQNGRWYDPTCVVVLGMNDARSTAFGAYFPIPKWMVDETLKNKTELGEVVRKYAGGGEKDPMKYLSGGTIPREQLLMQAIQCALTPLIFRSNYEVREND